MKKALLHYGLAMATMSLSSSMNFEGPTYRELAGPRKFAKSKLTKKQEKARAKAKRARKARRKKK